MNGRNKIFKKRQNTPDEARGKTRYPQSSYQPEERAMSSCQPMRDQRRLTHLDRLTANLHISGGGREILLPNREHKPLLYLSTPLLLKRIL
ncbi:hypothetical protein FKM82_008081 [Ascaphus truei]